jgi:hypothetical protein
VTVPPDFDVEVPLDVVALDVVLDELPHAASATIAPSARNALKADLVYLLTCPPPEKVLGTREI